MYSTHIVPSWMTQGRICWHRAKCHSGRPIASEDKGKILLVAARANKLLGQKKLFLSCLNLMMFVIRDVLQNHSIFANYLECLADTFYPAEFALSRCYASGALSFPVDEDGQLAIATAKL